MFFRLLWLFFLFSLPSPDFRTFFQWAFRGRIKEFSYANDQSLNFKKTQVNFGLFFLLYRDKLSSAASIRMPKIRAENVDTSTMTHLMG